MHSGLRPGLLPHFQSEVQHQPSAQRRAESAPPGHRRFRLRNGCFEPATEWNGYRPISRPEIPPSGHFPRPGGENGRCCTSDWKWGGNIIPKVMQTAVGSMGSMTYRMEGIPHEVVERLASLMDSRPYPRPVGTEWTCRTKEIGTFPDSVTGPYRPGPMDRADDSTGAGTEPSNPDISPDFVAWGWNP